MDYDCSSNKTTNMKKQETTTTQNKTIKNNNCVFLKNSNFLPTVTFPSIFGSLDASF